MSPTSRAVLGATMGVFTRDRHCSARVRAGHGGLVFCACDREDHRAHGRCGEDALLQHHRGRDGEQSDDDRVLDDRGEAVWQPVGTPGVDRHRDEAVDGAERNEKRFRESRRLKCSRRQVSRGSRCSDHCIDSERYGRCQQAATYVAV